MKGTLIACRPPVPACSLPAPCHRSDKEQGCERSIPGLMKALERGEMPAAPQPPGLTVTMRPYQLQSLQFMLDRERGEGDFRWAGSSFSVVATHAKPCPPAC